MLTCLSNVRLCYVPLTWVRFITTSPQCVCQCSLTPGGHCYRFPQCAQKLGTLQIFSSPTRSTTNGVSLINSNIVNSTINAAASLKIPWNLTHGLLTASIVISLQLDHLQLAHQERYK